MTWFDILKDARLERPYLELDDGKILSGDDLEITLELKEVQGNYRRKPSIFGGDKISDAYAPTSGFTEYGNYQYAFMPKLKGSITLVDENDVEIKEFKAEEIGVSFEGGSFKNIKDFPVPIKFKTELDYDNDKPFIYITMEVA